jgi:NMD protein affecting ribosome stability and mRNA decay
MTAIKEGIYEAESAVREVLRSIGDELENMFDTVDERLDKQYTKYD